MPTTGCCNFTGRAAAASGERARLEDLYPGDPERVDREEETWLEAHPIPEVPLARLADHVDHIRAVAGIDHVGLGSDFDGGFGSESVPAEIDTVADLGLVGAAMDEMGYADTDIGAILSGNWLRALRAGLPE